MISATARQKFGGGGPRHAFGPLGGGYHDEIVAADVPGEVVGRVAGFERVAQRRPGGADDAVSHSKAKRIGERLKMVEIEVSDAKRGAVFALRF